MIRDFYSQSSIYDDAAGHEGSPSCGSVTNNPKKTPPAVARRDPEAGSTVYITIFMVQE